MNTISLFPVYSLSDDLSNNLSFDPLSTALLRVREQLSRDYSGLQAIESPLINGLEEIDVFAKNVLNFKEGNSTKFGITVNLFSKSDMPNLVKMDLSFRRI
jgi:hypothetical protein